VTTSSSGFRVVGSNPPVTFGYDRSSVFAVSLRAPSWTVNEALTRMVQGGPTPTS
jgi:hypothetical protein